ncbi:MAG: amino acid permease [Bacteroidetes bacterium]|nr:amino acid permease [Bacteroidota bacterium]
MEGHTTELKPSLGLWDSTMVVAGSMIGSGIFIVSADIMRHVGSAGWLLAVWLITGFMTVIAAVSYGELSAMFPKAGGQYVYLKEAFNPLTGFLYGWSFFAVIQTATIAAVGVAFARFTSYFIPAFSEKNILINLNPSLDYKISAAQLISISVIVLLTYINTRGIKEGKTIQTIFTTTKLLALFGLIVFGFMLVKNSFWNENWQHAFTPMQDLGNKDAAGLLQPSGWKNIGMLALLGAIAASMTGSVFSSDAWNNVTFIAGEIKNPKRNVGLSLFLGTMLVSVIYIAANLMYLNTLPLHKVAFPEEERLAVAAANVIFGSAGQAIIAVLIMISTFGCINGLVLAGARVYYTMALDGLFFKKAGTLNKNAVPQWSLWAQCVIAAVLCLSGSYGQLLDMISFVAVGFYVLTIAGIFVLRKKSPDVERPYKAFGYPALPFIYILMGSAFCILLIFYKPVYALLGLVITLIGIPIYYIAVSNKKKMDTDKTVI